MEIESHWVAEIASRIEDAAVHDVPFAPARNGNGHLLPRINSSKSRQLALFSTGK
jgi:glutamate mutase epsilon subunit